MKHVPYSIFIVAILTIISCGTVQTDSSYRYGQQSSYRDSTQSNSHNSSYCEQRRREYERALAEYQGAVEEYRRSKSLQSINQNSWDNDLQHQDGGFMKGIGALGVLGANMMTSSAEDDLEAAKLRLRAAERQLCSGHYIEK